MVEQFRNAKSTMEFMRDGDNWTVDFQSDVVPSKTYKFQPGKEIESTDPYGGAVKVMCSFKHNLHILQRIDVFNCDRKSVLLMQCYLFSRLGNIYKYNTEITRDVL